MGTRGVHEWESRGREVGEVSGSVIREVEYVEGRVVKREGKGDMVRKGQQMRGGVRGVCV